VAFEEIILELAIIFGGVAVLSTLFVFARQPIILSYIALGMIVGPFGASLIKRVDHIEHISHIGIVLLLFLVGLNLHPHKLLALFKKTAIVTAATCLIFAAVFGVIAFVYHLTLIESLIVGVALMFSSTIVGLKLTPTTTLHQKHLGEMMVSVLLLQDIIAVIVILVLEGSGKPNLHFYLPLLLAKSIGLIAVAFFLVKYGVLWLFKKFDTIQEYILVLALGWCLAISAASKALGMSYEIGAFIAGCSLAISPVALVMSEKLKPLREFFLILFFFSIGTQFDFLLLKHVVRPSLVLAAFIIIIKPYAFSKAFARLSEPRKTAGELGFRLGQASEFSLLVAYMAIESSIISNKASYIIQLTTILTFIVSTYIVTYRYPTPIGSYKTLRAD
jgi:Kef-type K+ transport system membrane component KefB